MVCNARGFVKSQATNITRVNWRLGKITSKLSSSKIITVSGASGSGKTSVVRRLAVQYDCPYLLFDEHLDKNSYPENMKHWFEVSADVNAFKTPKLIDALTQLKATGHQKFIFVEEPFGRQRDAIAPLIDSVILLDPPLEICLCRLIKRNLEYHEGELPSSIVQYLANYEDHFRDIYLECVNEVRQNCDLVIEQNDTIDLAIQSISQWLETQK